MSIDFILRHQNPDGGWPYLRGQSWTEPSVYAVMALWSAGERESAQSGMRWILSMQRPDGGWAPQAEVDQSTWVTGLAGLLPPELLGPVVYDRTIHWLLSASGAESSVFHRLRAWMVGSQLPKKESEAWPWMPGTAAWVGPTCVAILALEKAKRRTPSPEVFRRVREGREFLLSRSCRNGGWNHGSSFVLGVDATAYPETTGMALTALHGMQCDKVEQSLRMAADFLKECRSADALNWLRLGLLAHNRLPADYIPPADLVRRTLVEASLDLLVGQVKKGQTHFWG